jgi:hypothetical protein
MWCAKVGESEGGEGRRRGSRRVRTKSHRLLNVRLAPRSSMVTMVVGAHSMLSGQCTSNRTLLDLLVGTSCGGASTATVLAGAVRFDAITWGELTPTEVRNLRVTTLSSELLQPNPAS